jgi:hypothetical protein
MSASITSGSYPRGTDWPRVWLVRIASALWQFSTRTGAERAQRHLGVLALRFEAGDPALAAQLRATGRACLR